MACSRGVAVNQYWLILVLLLVPGGRVLAQVAPQFNRDIRPILADKCFACHGMDAKKREAGLRLDTFEGATSEIEGTLPVAPGDLGRSELWKRILSKDDSNRMPPPDSHKELSPPEVDLIKRWIESGAKYQKHWSFETPIRTPVPPQVANGRNPIDAWIGQRLEKEGFSIAPEASKSILIRRVAFALTGLPPTIEAQDAYVADDSPNAYENMVDQFLRTTAYGEEMARHWLDVARYADTHGLHLDNERQMWAYRDWVVKSFNRNQPFDQFTVEQLAGDLLPNPTTDQLVATGFNRCNVSTSEGGSIDAEFHFRYAVDRASTTASTWMAMTAGCAVCHDHKFDPISAKEFYSLYAFFNSSADPAMDGNALLTNPVLKLESDSDKVKLAEFDVKIAENKKHLEEQLAKIQYDDPALAVPNPPVSSLETVWLEDDFPAGGQAAGGPGSPTLFVSLEQKEKVFSGQRALKRSDSGLSQDVWDRATTPLLVPSNATFFAYVYLDPANPPQSIMLQYHKNGWMHRAVWGNYDVIPWGAPNTPERFSMGGLPKLGEWVRLEVPADKIGLTERDQLTGFATTQFGGTVYWDKVGVQGTSDPANDPLRSMLAWWKSTTGKDTPGLPADLNSIAKSGPDATSDADQRERLKRYYMEKVCIDTKPKLESSVAAMDKVRGEREAFYNSIPSTFIYKDAEQPRESFVMIRGQYNLPGEKVLAGVPAIFPAIRKQETQPRLTRLDLANWLVSPEHPLTARVTVNRFWQQMFGVGLVKSSGDFGTQGELPVHPELLDWLAMHFQDNHWDVKQLIRLMVTSATFRQSSRVSKDLLDKDPENRLLARGPRLRLDAEQLRDNALFVSGLMDMTLGGKGVKPYQPNNVWEPVGFVGSNTRMYQRDNGSALYRRSLYTFYKRTAPPPFMVNFDAPNREQSCTRRERSNTPLQALQLLNDTQHVEASRALAERLLAQSNIDSEGRIRTLFRLVLAREPDPNELQIVQRQLAEHLARYLSNPADAKSLISQGESKSVSKASEAELAAYTLVASTILNMDETLTRN